MLLVELPMFMSHGLGFNIKEVSNNTRNGTAVVGGSFFST